MTAGAMKLGILMFVCIGAGMLLGAWFATRGFEKSLIEKLDDPGAPWNKDE